MKLSDFNFELPNELLAEFPAENRDESRLMVLNRKEHTIEHHKFKDVINFFDEGDVVVSMAFLLPGKHAGEGGDVDQIIERARIQHPKLRIHRTPLLGSQRLVHEVLRDRVRLVDQEQDASF